MFRLLTALLFTLAGLSLSSAQQPAVSADGLQKPSSLVQPAIDSVAHAGSAVDLNRWKGSGGVREEVDANLASVQKNIEIALPPLLATADAAPASAAASLPVLLNLDALYSVVLRVTIAARSNAPRDQSAALEQSAVLLDAARRDLGNAILAAAKAQEKRADELQATLQQQASTAATTQTSSPPAQTPAPPAPKSKKRRAAPKPIAPAATNPQ